MKEKLIFDNVFCVGVACCVARDPRTGSMVQSTARA